MRPRGRRPRARRAARERGALLAARIAHHARASGRRGSPCATTVRASRPDEQEAIFERFHRGSAGLAGPPGSGLGLAIARELAREWGGEVTLANAEGGGALATLRLRVYEP